MPVYCSQGKVAKHWRIVYKSYVKQYSIVLEKKIIKRIIKQAIGGIID